MYIKRACRRRNIHIIWNSTTWDAAEIPFISKISIFHACYHVSETASVRVSGAVQFYNHFRLVNTNNGSTKCAHTQWISNFEWTACATSAACNFPIFSSILSVSFLAVHFTIYCYRNSEPRAPYVMSLWICLASSLIEYALNEKYVGVWLWR